MVKELEDNICISFAELVECKDQNISGHVMRTGVFVELLTKELFESGIFKDELKPEDAVLMRRGAPFHDIGKIGVSDILLLKRSPLTDEEYKEVQKHTLIGGQMLRQIFSRITSEQYLKHAMIIAEGHHERFDGKGYPKGLKGDEIPLYSRIMAVVNVYDACVTDRVYRKNMTHEQACQVIKDGAGKQFDPRIVEVFSKIQGKFAMIQTSSFIPQQSIEWSYSHETNIGN